MTQLPHFAFAAFSLALLWCVPAAHALPPHGRQATGAVRDVDRAAQTLAIQSAADPQPRIYRWNESTRFTAAGSAITTAAIPRGATVAFTYHTPLIGGPFVTSVAMLHPLPARPKRPAQTPSTHARRP